MLNAAQLHLGLNHLPVFGAIIGFFVLATGLVLMRQGVKTIGLGILIFGALSVAPVYLTGEPAEKIVEHRPGVSEAVIHNHEEAAELSLIFCALTGLASAATLLLPRIKGVNFHTQAAFGSSALALITVVLLVRTAHLGGMIRHDEIRTAQATAIGAAAETEDDDKD